MALDSWALACCALVALVVSWVSAFRDHNWLQAQWRAVALASFIFFMVLNQCSKQLACRILGGDAAFMAIPQGAKFQNTLVSLAHAIVSSILCCVALGTAITSWEQVDVAVYAAANPLAQISGAVTLGYNIVDVFDALRTDQAGHKRAVMAHHVLMSVGIVISNTMEVGELFLQVAFLCEINSIFLHCRTLMRLAGFNLKHTAYMAVWAGLWATMLFLRFMPHAGLVVVSVMDFERLANMSRAGENLVILASVSFAAITAFNLALAITLGRIHAKDWEAMRSKGNKAE